MNPAAIEARFQDGNTFAAAGLIFGLVGYVYLALTLTVLAKKTQTPNAWLAWVPLLNLFLICAVGRRSNAWVLALLIPCVNLLALAYVWGGIAEARGRSAAWGLLIMVPVLNLLLPLILALGPAHGGTSAIGKSAEAVATPANCSQCRGAIQPGDAFCGNCGARVLPVAALAHGNPPAMPAKRGSGCLAAALILGGGCVVMLGACGVGGFFLLQPALYAAPTRQAPAIPTGIAGTIAVLPRDSDPTLPASPISFTSQTFSGPQGGFDGDVRIPSEQLPPGLDASFLPQVAISATSAVYQAQPNAPLVNIQVLGTGQNPSAGSQITDKVVQATGGISTRVTIENPVGGTFNGSRIDANGSTIFVLTPPAQDVVICIFTADPAGAATADRLAATLGNGQGVADPQFDPYVCVLPAADPPELTLEQVNGRSGAVPMQALGNISDDPVADQGMRDTLSQLQIFLPDRITVAGYRDTQVRLWEVVVLEYPTNALAWRNWQIARWIFGWGATGSARTAGTSALVFDDGQDRIVIFCRGPYFVILHGPSAAGIDQFEALGDSFQF